MNSSQDDIQVLKKVNMIVKENLPGFNKNSDTKCKLQPITRHLAFKPGNNY